MDAECCGVLDGAADMLLEINAKENGVASFACGYMDERVSFHIRGVLILIKPPRLIIRIMVPSGLPQKSPGSLFSVPLCLCG